MKMTTLVAFLSLAFYCTSITRTEPGGDFDTDGDVDGNDFLTWLRGEPSFGVNTDGVVMIGKLRDSGEPDSTCSGALISDRHVLSAAHCFDSFGTGEVDPGQSLSWRGVRSFALRQPAAPTA